MSKNAQHWISMVRKFEFNGFMLLIRCESIHFEKEKKERNLSIYISGLRDIEVFFPLLLALARYQFVVGAIVDFTTLFSVHIQAYFVFNDTIRVYKMVSSVRSNIIAS